MISVWKDFDRKKNADNVISNQVIHCHELAHRLHSFQKKSQQIIVGMETFHCWACHTVPGKGCSEDNR